MKNAGIISGIFDENMFCYGDYWNLFLKNFLEVMD